MLDPGFADHLDRLLAADDADRARRYPGPVTGRRPIHTVCVPADRFGEHTVSEWRALAIGALDHHGPLPGTDRVVEDLVRDRLAELPVEDLRIDLAAATGTPSGTEEEDARAAGDALGRLLRAGTAPPFTGVRTASLEPATRRRGVRSLEVFLETMLGFGGLPRGFRVTLPRVTSVAQVQAMVELCAALESAYTLPMLRFELQLGMPQAVLGPDGAATVARMVHSAAGRCVGLLVDTDVALTDADTGPDTTALADHATAVVQLAAAGTGVPVGDGPTTVLPVGDRDQVRAGWALHGRRVRRSLDRGLSRGWDVHPAQLPARFAATIGFYRDAAPATISRLRDCLAERDGGPVTVLRLAAFLLRGVEAGALDPAELTAATGLTTDELRRSAGRPT